MPWMIGVDEAGYGPNLGPFVMSMAALHVPEEYAGADLWRLHANVVRKHAEDDDRLWVADSKVIYTAGGLEALERNVLPFLKKGDAAQFDLGALWSDVCLSPYAELEVEPWYVDGLRFPIHPPIARSASKGECTPPCLRCGLSSVVVFPRQFNELIAKHDTKAAVPAWALGQLLNAMPPPRDNGVTRIAIDKLGGRNRYQPMLQAIFPNSLVMARIESARESTYQVIRPEGNCEITLQPEADGRFFLTALASMVSKYLREVLMIQFNRFWQQHVPGLKPTAGYPVDAKRFYEDTRAVREQLGLSDHQLWRTR